MNVAADGLLYQIDLFENLQFPTLSPTFSSPYIGLTYKGLICTLRKSGNHAATLDSKNGSIRSGTSTCISKRSLCLIVCIADLQYLE